MIAGPPALVRMPTRRPAGSGWVESSEATSSSSERVSARITPALLEEGVDGAVGGREQRSGVGAGGAGADRRAPALDDDDRLAACRPASRPARTGRGLLNDSM